MAVSADDQEIPDSEVLYRRIAPVWVEPDPISGERRLTSAAFQNQQGHEAFSVHRSTLINPENVVAPFPGYGVVCFTAGEARSLGQGVTPEPTIDDPSHAHVIGRKTGGVKNKFRSIAIWIVDIR